MSSFIAKGALFLTVVLLAFTPLKAAGWTTSVQVNSFIPTESQLTLVVSAHDNALGCTSPTWLHLHAADSEFALISSSLLTAFAQGKSVKVWASNCDSDGGTHFIAAWIDR